MAEGYEPKYITPDEFNAVEHITDLGSMTNKDLNTLTDKTYVGYWSSGNRDGISNKPANFAGTIYFFNAGTDRSLQFCVGTGNGEVYVRFISGATIYNWTKIV